MSLEQKLKQISELDATPAKRSYLAIVNDYDFKSAICELIDNPIDIWVRSERAFSLLVSIAINVDHQTITISDNSGGIGKENLIFVVQPGASSASETDQSIGIFGVGSKRSVIALAKDISIISRRVGAPPYLIQYGDEWIALPTWKIPCYETSTGEEGQTVIHLQKLRQNIGYSEIRALIDHISSTYGVFLKDKNLQVFVNEEKISPLLFENWSYPPDFTPKQVNASIETNFGKFKYSITSGLLTESAYASGEYGVYFYCNDRLVAKSVRAPEVGFVSGKAGVEHHGHSAARTIVSMHGPARWMPWNSSKSGINYSHESFLKMQELLWELVSTYSVISRRLVKRWDDEVFPYKSGDIEVINIAPDDKVSSLPLPALPTVRPSYANEILSENKNVIRSGPWRETYVDAIIAIHALQRQRLTARNELSVILLDGVLEMALQDYLSNETKNSEIILASQSVPLDRNYILRAMKTPLSIPQKTLTTLHRLEDLRVKLRVSATRLNIEDSQIEEFRMALQVLFHKCFGIRFPDRSDQTFS